MNSNRSQLNEMGLHEHGDSVSSSGFCNSVDDAVRVSALESIRNYDSANNRVFIQPVYVETLDDYLDELARLERLAIMNS